MEEGEDRSWEMETDLGFLCLCPFSSGKAWRVRGSRFNRFQLDSTSENGREMELKEEKCRIIKRGGRKSLSFTFCFLTLFLDWGSYLSTSNERLRDSRDRQIKRNSRSRET